MIQSLIWPGRLVAVQVQIGAFEHRGCKSKYARGPWQPVSQAVLMNIVRHHRSLRWLRSDLTSENVAILQQERPLVTFVSD